MSTRSVAQPLLVVMAARGAKSFTASERERLAAVARVRYVPAMKPLSRRAFVDAFADADFAAWTPRGTPASVRGLFPNLRAVAIPTTGQEWLDTDRPVINVPDFSSASCAEMTWLLLLQLARRDRVEIEGKSLGIVGHGAVGSRVRKIAEAFGMRTMLHDPARSDSVPLRRLLARCDFVSLHCPLTPKTRDFIKVEKPFRLVNTARPDLVALSEARKLKGYAVDTGYWNAAQVAQLRRLPNAIVVPHISWYTHEAVERERQRWVANMVAMVTT